MPHAFCESETLALLREAEAAHAGPVAVETLAAMLGTTSDVLAPVLAKLDGRHVVVTSDAPGGASVRLTPEGRSLIAARIEQTR